MAVNEALKVFQNSDQNKLEFNTSRQYSINYSKTATNVFFVNGGWGTFGFIPFKWDEQNYYA